MAAIDVGLGVTVLTAYHAGDEGDAEPVVRAHRAASEHTDSETIDSLVSLNLSQLAMLTGFDGDQPAKTLEKVSRMTRTVLLVGYDVDVAIDVMTVFLHAAKDQDENQALRRARNAAASYASSEVLDSLIALGVSLLALLQVERGHTEVETLRQISSTTQLAAVWSDTSPIKLLRPRTFAKMIVDSYNASHGPDEALDVGEPGPPTKRRHRRGGRRQSIADSGFAVTGDGPWEICAAHWTVCIGQPLLSSLLTSAGFAPDVVG